MSGINANAINKSSRNNVVQSKQENILDSLFLLIATGLVFVVVTLLTIIRRRLTKD